MATMRKKLISNSLNGEMAMNSRRIADRNNSTRKTHNVPRHRWGRLGVLAGGILVVAVIIMLSLRHPLALNVSDIHANLPMKPPSSDRTADSPSSSGILAIGSSSRGDMPQIRESARLPADNDRKPDELANRQLAIRQVVKLYRDAKFNVFADTGEAIRVLVSSGSGGISDLVSLLENTEELRELPSDIVFMEAKPDIVIERMAAIDMLKEMAATDPAAREALVKQILEPMDRDWPSQVTKSVAGDKYDMLLGLARLDADMAVQVYRTVKSNVLQEYLRPALIAGLYEADISLEKRTKMLENL